MAEEEIKEEKKEGVKEEIEKVGKSVLVKLGFWCFLIGVIVALIVGIVIGYDPTIQGQDVWGYIATLLAVLGLIVGIVSVLGFGTITEYEVTKFLIASVAVVVVGAGGAVAFGYIPMVGPYFEGITLALLLFFAPAAVVIALKALWDIGKD